jgi:hypothetical protein
VHAAKQAVKDCMPACESRLAEALLAFSDFGFTPEVGEGCSFKALVCCGGNTGLVVEVCRGVPVRHTIHD